MIAGVSAVLQNNDLGPSTTYFSPVALEEWMAASAGVDAYRQVRWPHQLAGTLFTKVNQQAIVSQL